MAANADSCDSARLKAQQKEYFQKALYVTALIAMTLALILWPLALLALVVLPFFWLPGKIYAVYLISLFAIPTLALLFKPTIQLYYCRLRNKVKGRQTP